MERTHEPQNVALVVGDFNIDAHNQGRYEALRDRMERLGMEDLWRRRNGGPGDTEYFDGVDGVEVQKREAICPDALRERYCNDLAHHTDVAGRVDYIFAERPRPEHTLTIDFTRPRRVPLRRPEETDGMVFMSDHIGLETTLIIVPK